MTSVSIFTVFALCLVPSALPAPLAGTVRSFDGVPIAGATVVLHQGQRMQTTVVDASGAYSFADAVLPATVEVSAFRSGPALGVRRGFRRPAGVQQRG